MSIYEYQTIRVHPTKKTNEKELNEMGSQGWKLVTSLIQDGYTTSLIFMKKSE